MSIIILRNVRIWKVGFFVDLSVIGLDVKLNLQETDYGNFLGDEVCFVSSICLSSLVFPYSSQHGSQMCSQEACRRVDLYEGSGYAASCAIHGFHLVFNELVL